MPLNMGVKHTGYWYRYYGAKLKNGIKFRQKGNQGNQKRKLYYCYYY